MYMEKAITHFTKISHLVISSKGLVVTVTFYLLLPLWLRIQREYKLYLLIKKSIKLDATQ